jgi:hypothetical protein
MSSASRSPACRPTHSATDPQPMVTPVR